MTGQHQETDILDWLADKALWLIFIVLPLAVLALVRKPRTTLAVVLVVAIAVMFASADPALISVGVGLVLSAVWLGLTGPGRRLYAVLDPRRDWHGWEHPRDRSAIKGDAEAVRILRSVLKVWNDAWAETGVARKVADSRGRIRSEYPAIRSVERVAVGLKLLVQVPEGFAPSQILNALAVVNVGWQLIETHPGREYQRLVELTLVVPEWSQMGGTYRPEPPSDPSEDEPWDESPWGDI